MSAAPTVVLFAKPPLAGLVKTRLAAQVGEKQALAFYVQTLSAVMQRLCAEEAWRFEVAVTPDEAVQEPYFLDAHVRLRPQGDGDLGARMGRVLAAARPDAPVLIVGSDVPEVSTDHVRSAIEALTEHDLVLGPSPDGGYWLIGASRPQPADLFRGVRWSTPHARSDTLANTAELSVALLDWLEDVDDAASYARWRNRVGSDHQLQAAPPSTQNFAQ